MTYKEHVQSRLTFYKERLSKTCLPKWEPGEGLGSEGRGPEQKLRAERAQGNPKCHTPSHPKVCWGGAVRAECPENRKCPQANDGPFSTPGLIPMHQLEPIHTPVNLPRTRAPPTLKPQSLRTGTPGLDTPALGSPSLPSVASSAESGTTQPTTPSPSPARFRLGGSGQASSTHR